MIDWQDLHHSELSVSQLYALLQLRCAVFVVEQNCPYLDVDSDLLRLAIFMKRTVLRISGWRAKSFRRNR